jgi:hypothetical protein
MTYPDTGSTQDLTKEKLHELLIEVDLEYLVDRPVRTINATWSIFCAIFTFKRSFYQDRLGANIGKALKNSCISRRVCSPTRSTGESTRRIEHECNGRGLCIYIYTSALVT